MNPQPSTTGSHPDTMHALVVPAEGKPSVDQAYPVPSPGPGSIVIRVLHAMCHPGTKDILTNKVPWITRASPWSRVPGGFGVGRVAATGPDATVFEPGQLVMFDPFVLARDDPSVAILWGMFSGPDDRTREFTRKNWKDGSWAQYTRVGLENAWVLDEEKLLTKQGLAEKDIVWLGPLCVAYGGFRTVDLKPGETVAISPSTGVFSGGAVAVARAMGCRVIAMARNKDRVAALASSLPGIETFVFTGDDDADVASLQAMGPIDVFADVSPPGAVGTSNLGVGMRSVRTRGRICLMGGRGDEVLPIAYTAMVHKRLRIEGSWMYEREHVRGLIQMAEAGVLKLGPKGGLNVVAEYGLDEWEKAVEVAQDTSGAGTLVVWTP